MRITYVTMYLLSYVDVKGKIDSFDRLPYQSQSLSKHDRHL